VKTSLFFAFLRGALGHLRGDFVSVLGVENELVIVTDMCAGLEIYKKNYRSSGQSLVANIYGYVLKRTVLSVPKKPNNNTTSWTPTGTRHPAGLPTPRGHPRAPTGPLASHGTEGTPTTTWGTQVLIFFFTPLDVSTTLGGTTPRFSNFFNCS
jgi:hypothetical protein